MTATLRDVAALAGVSIMTVSNVLNDHPHVRIATRERVEQAIAQLGYQPNLTARSLRSGRTGVIGLALPDMRLSYFAELAASIIRVAERRGLTVIIEQTGGDRDREIQLLRSPRRKLTDGLIFSPLGMGQDDAHLLEVRYPLVILGERIFGGPTDHVTMQNLDAAAAATRLLLTRGRRRIAVVGAHHGEVVGSAALRLSGYRLALEEAGLPFDPTLLGYASLWHRADGANAMRQLLAEKVEFDAVFGLNDTLALGAMRMLQASGISVPEEVAVMGFDNLDEAQYSLPTLTTVDPGREEISQSAVSALVQRIEDGAKETPRREIRSGFSIVERESTAVLP
jgi:DNA-binding LacI/PurR family transcriptional regulator